MFHVPKSARPLSSDIELLRFLLWLADSTVMNLGNRLILAAYVLGAQFTQNVQAVDPTVTIKPGVVIGSQTSVVSGAQETVQVNQYLGIPFAAPPTGSRRFAPPAPTSWNEPVEAKSLPPACMQQFICKGKLLG